MLPRSSRRGALCRALFGAGPLLCAACSGGGSGAPALEPVVVTASPLAVGSVGAPYSLSLAVADGTGPYAWSVLAGVLPTGLTLGADGSLAGTPLGAGTFDFTVQVSDDAGAAATKPLTLLITAALLPALPSNGSFELGLTSWVQLGAGSGAQYSVVADAVDGSSAVRVDGRSQLYHAPAQDVFSAQLAGAGGTPATTRFWIKLDAPAMARCLIRLTSDLGGGQMVTSRLILAEEVVRTAGEWLEVQGTAVLSWSGTLTAASLEFDVGQPAEGVHPGFTLDGVRVERDADSDGLPDADESPNVASDPDRDHDGLDDGWETRHAAARLDPAVADADLDADSDGYSNHQEHWAATGPLDAASMPGVPSVPGASAEVVALTRTLALLPSQEENRIVSGQHITGIPSAGGLAGEFASNVQALHDDTGRWPGILSLQYEGADSSIGPLQVDLVNPFALDWAAAGGLVLIKFQPFDPWTLAIQSPAGGAHVDLVALLDPAAGNPADFAANSAASAVWMDWLDQMATGLDQLRQTGVTVLWRPLSEMNNVAHWHSRQPRAAWIALWRHMHAYLSVARGLDNLVWVYEGDSAAHATVPADYYYPGDDVVDLMGHNFYDDDWVLPYDLDARFRRYPKIYGFPQAGSSTVRDGTWDNLTIIQGVKLRNPRASLFCTWNDFYSGGVFNARSMVSQANAMALLDDPWVVTREELDP